MTQGIRKRRRVQDVTELERKANAARRMRSFRLYVCTEPGKPSLISDLWAADGELPPEWTAAISDPATRSARMLRSGRKFKTYERQEAAPAASMAEAV